MSVTVQNGVNQITSDLAGKSVSEVRSMLRQPLNIDGAAKAYVNGEEVGLDDLLQDGETLEFIKASGTKGGLA